MSRVPILQVHSTAPSLIIDGAWCARLVLKPEGGACSCQRFGPEERQGSPPPVFEMTGRDWAAVAPRTRVQLVVLPGVPPLLFVTEPRWGLETCEGGKARAPVPIGHRSRVLSRPPVVPLCILYPVPDLCGRLPRAGRGGAAPTRT